MSELDHGMRKDTLVNYLSARGAQGHYDKYQKWNKRLTHRIECARLHRLLEQVGYSHEILDAPCGPGRFFEVLKKHADEVHLGDISESMLDVAREQTQNRGAMYTILDLRQTGPDTCAYEGVVSLRLSHHLHTSDALASYLHGLAHLSRRWMIITFRDARSPKTAWRNFWRRLFRRDLIPAQTVDDMVATMNTHGFFLVASEGAFLWFSDHRYALFVRKGV